MAEGKPQQEPSMEEILASIRRIISEDGTEQEAEPAAKAAPPDPEPPPPEPPPAPEPEPEPEPEPAPPPPPVSVLEPEEEEILELTERVDTPPPDPDPEPLPPRPAAPSFPDDGGLLSADADAAAREALHRLDGFDELPVGYGTAEGDGSKTLERLVAELLQPMLRDWLNTNLPGIVERIVEREVRRLGRGR